MTTYAADDLHSEIAYLAHHLHWPFNELLDLEHVRRSQFLRHVKDFDHHLRDRN
ncbi:hypothetical protein [Streptomyces sp. H27-C3]|uniref:hypothetical protein n=1 Tax=Streptomyces sp. H27-C3 TaxID=3046305 RepID=UPI0024B87E09|nr:hypothetical protein [Streptomyces sp. H27-C3]MDJ0466195.1 hypothetical protein [Streptomyces sp. H27-C3]